MRNTHDKINSGRGIVEEKINGHVYKAQKLQKETERTKV